MLIRQMHVGSWVKIKNPLDTSDEFFSSGQDSFQGEKTIICKVCSKHCHLSCDKGYSSWGPRNLTLISQDVSLIEEGSTVILGSHDWVNNNRDWYPEQEQYVGKTAKVIRVFSSGGLRVATTDINEGFSWRVCNMTLVG
jgi:hypothetical protein